MKELTTLIKYGLDSMEGRWKQLPQKDSRRIVRYSFAVYVLLTIGVIVQVAYQVSTSKSSMEIEHITNPVKVRVNTKNKSN